MISILFRLLSFLTFKRLINLLKNEASYYFSLVSGKPRMAGLPWAIAIEPTTSCNLRCPECPSGLRKFSRPTGNMSLELFERIIDQLSPHLIYLTLYFQGEPLLNRCFFEMVLYAKKKCIYVASSTNGHFLDTCKARQLVESGLDRLIISMDGTDQETYSKYRIGGNLETVKEGIANVIRWKKELGFSHPMVELQFLVLGTNEHQIDDIRLAAKELQVDKLTLKTAQLYEYGKNPFFTSLSRYARYDTMPNGSLKPRTHYPNHCHRMWHSPVITWDGKIVPCCFDKDAGHIMGDLTASTFIESWNDNAYKGFRQKIIVHRKGIEICRNCTEGLKEK
jgi:radical SAM protein with 4Fe4S-binding SPASM domain